MDALRYDLRLAWRGLARAPLATVLAVACLALGIGTNATMFGMVSSLLLTPLPFRDPDQLVTVESRQPQGGVTHGDLSYLDLSDYQAQSRTLDAVVGVESRSLTFSDTDEPERVVGASVSWHLVDGRLAGFRLTDDPSGTWFTVIGVVADVMIEEVGDREVTPSAFIAYPYQETPNTGLVVRASGDAVALTAQIRAAIHASGPVLPVFAASSMETIRRQGFWQYALFGEMFATFGVLALVLAVVGVYGVLSYSVSQRTQEFGVRMALGAEPGDVRRMMIRQGLGLAGWGIGVGVVGAFGVTRLQLHRSRAHAGGPGRGHYKAGDASPLWMRRASSRRPRRR